MPVLPTPNIIPTPNKLMTTYQKFSRTILLIHHIFTIDDLLLQPLNSTDSNGVWLTTLRQKLSEQAAEAEHIQYKPHLIQP